MPDCEQALADRFVEAFAEKLHADMRKEIWGYAPEEQASARRNDICGGMVGRLERLPDVRCS